MNGYQGTYQGQHYSSIYPNLYRVRAVAYIGGRRYDLDQVVSATDDAHARGRVQRRYGDIRGAVAVERVASLDREA